MSFNQLVTVGNIATALVLLALLAAFGVHYLSRLDPGTRDKLGGAQHRRWGVWCMGAGHGKRGQE